MLSAYFKSITLFYLGSWKTRARPRSRAACRNLSLNEVKIQQCNSISRISIKHADNKTTLFIYLTRLECDFGNNIAYNIRPSIVEISLHIHILRFGLALYARVPRIFMYSLQLVHVSFRILDPQIKLITQIYTLHLLIHELSTSIPVRLIA